MNGWLIFLLNWVLSASLQLFGDALRRRLFDLSTGNESDTPHYPILMAKNHQYPHLLPDDILVWEQFLAQHRHMFETFDYDVRVGKGRPRPDLPTENLRRMATDLSQRRIDVVGHSPGQLTIIEITHSAGLKALGQMQAYPILYREAFDYQDNLKSLLVAGALESDIVPCLRQAKIPFWTPARGLNGF